MNFRQSRLLLVGSIGIIVIIFAVVAAYFVVQPQKLAPDVLARVDKKDITKKDLQERMWVKVQFTGKQEDQDIKSSNAKASLDELVEAAIVESEAVKLGISVQKSDIEKYIKAQGFVLASYLTDHQKQLLLDFHKLGFLKKAVSDKVVDWKELEYVEIPIWIRYFKDNTGYKSDLVYGKKLGLDIYNNWKSGKTDYAGAVKAAENDPRVGRQGVVAMYGLKYLAFGSILNAESYKSSTQVDYKKLFGALKLGFNEPIVLVTNISDLESTSIGANPVRTEASIIVAHVTKVNDEKNVSASYEEWLKKVTTSHKVIRNVK